METLQKAGAFALIFGAKCLRHALTTLADMQADPDCPRPSDDDQLRALRDQVEAMSASLRAIKATLGTGEPDSGNSLLQ
jgi:hypothetical protein